MTTLQDLAVRSAAAVRLGAADRARHAELCAMCRPDQECPRAAEMFTDHQARVQRSRSNLLAYLPRTSMITYAGKVRNLHGEWWVADTCADCDHTAYRLTRPRGMAMRHAHLSEISSAPVLHPGAGEALAPAREAAREAAAILAMCGIVVPIIVDINGLGACTFAYPRATWEHELSVAETADTVEGSYAAATLRTFPDLATATSRGNALGIHRMSRVLDKLRAAAQDTRGKSN
ncbi:hypothetical protein FXF51_01795 [Nonomuraea sp. PA05]|uniref:hypothetical protein n=1 Tax=Nonomuraea sp. PA05 TaxID=2604466 RepID=UPI0011D88DCE|nr:hypothetical protein [Nonomuraea sp. PA05]TYB71194.1 hypothetical protein FXF51_01795 [Nonomuraea sp. PA05]